VACGAEAAGIPDEGNERGGREQADTRHAQQATDVGQLPGEGRELLLTAVDAALEIPDLGAHFGEEGAQCVGNLGIGILDGCPGQWYGTACAERDHDALLAQQAAQRVDASGERYAPQARRSGADAASRAAAGFGDLIGTGRIWSLR
jgi:hypothetical protein